MSYYIQLTQEERYHISVLCKEGFSMTIFNSAAAGLPIVTSRIGAAADYLKEPDNCLWIEPKDCEMLAEKMSYLLNHPQLREKMAINNRKLAQQFSSERVGVEFLKIYSKMQVQGVDCHVKFVDHITDTA